MYESVAARGMSSSVHVAGGRRRRNAPRAGAEALTCRLHEDPRPTVFKRKPAEAAGSCTVSRKEGLESEAHATHVEAKRSSARGASNSREGWVVGRGRRSEVAAPVITRLGGRGRAGAAAARVRRAWLVGRAVAVRRGTPPRRLDTAASPRACGRAAQMPRRDERVGARLGSS